MAMKICKCGLDPDHIFYGGELLKVWLKKIFNEIIAVTVCLGGKIRLLLL